ncbi:DUF441 domain-containing protein [Kingella sp. (in: b-proteobacteria)]|uniref:DUF441 domain-containing protein n=1 Tax=Kingella sp. (in: b-proteobacteria) TaxID=2020713 RepID=UPI0026DCCBC5|nr:DUF441 domain-containing protein [Kingella sp. (in: b-proteobacteria)]MDO4657498.1 DUF441 domain-containing protein [Kingella sp. (in: b-proteobacteria)]
MNWTFNPVSILLIVFIALGYFSKNGAIWISSSILLVVQQTVLTRYLPQADRPLISLGILILTIGILAPLVSGKVQLPPISQLLDIKLFTAVPTGIFVAWLAGRGIGVMQSQPNLIIGLLVGTVIGVTFFNGIPVGPLIAGGLLSLLFMNSK